jgi:hypothetical protein
MEEDRPEVKQRPLWFHWLLNTAFVLVVALPTGVDWGLVPFAVVGAVLLTPLTWRWERRAGRRA